MEFEVTRWTQEIEGGAQSMDIVCIETDYGDVTMPTEMFRLLFDVEIQPNTSRVLALVVKAKVSQVSEDVDV